MYLGGGGVGMGTRLVNFHMCCIMLMLRAILSIVRNASLSAYVLGA